MLTLLVSRSRATNLPCSVKLLSFATMEKATKAGISSLHIPSSTQVESPGAAEPRSTGWATVSDSYAAARPVAPASDPRPGSRPQHVQASLGVTELGGPAPASSMCGLGFVRVPASKEMMSLLGNVLVFLVLLWLGPSSAKSQHHKERCSVCLAVAKEMGIELAKTANSTEVIELARFYYKLRHIFWR